MHQRQTAGMRQCITYSLEVNIATADLLQLAGFQRQATRYARVPVVKLQLRHQQLRVVLDTDPVAVVQVTPQLTGLGQHTSVSHRVLTAQRMALAQNLVQQVAELPRHDPVVLDRLPDGNGPEGMAALAVERPDDGRPDVLDLDGHLLDAQRFGDAHGLWVEERVQH